MSIITVSATKTVGKLINYVNKKAVLSAGTVPPEFAINQFEIIRNIYNKNTGRQGHHVIQSHRPDDNVSPHEALAMADELARNIAKGHDYIVAVHNDKDHIHAHIVINSVHAENGLKFQQTKRDLYEWRKINDEICLNYGIVPVKKDKSSIRYSYREKQLLKRTGKSKNEEVRKAIDEVLSADYETEINSFGDFAFELEHKYGIIPRIRTRKRDGKQSITYDDKYGGHKVRSHRLGNAYTLEVINHHIEVQYKADKWKDNDLSL